MTAEADEEKLNAIFAKAEALLLRKYGNPGYGKELVSHVKDEEYDYGDTIEDLEDMDSQLVDYMANHMKIVNVEQREELLSVLRILFGLETDRGHQIASIEWTYTSTDVLNMRHKMSILCPRTIKESEDASMLQIMAIGANNNNTPLLTLLYDIYTKYRMQTAMKKKTSDWAFIGPDTKVEQFSDMIRNKIPDLVGNAVLFNAMKSSLVLFEKRLNPGYKIKRSRWMCDRCDDYIAYTLLMTNAINTYIHSNPNCFPLQIDLVIVPAFAETTSNFTMDSFDGVLESDSSDEDNDNNTRKQNKHKREQKENNTNDNSSQVNSSTSTGANLHKALQTNFPNQFSHQNISCVAPNFNASANQPLFNESQAQRAIVEEIGKHTQGGAGHRRLSIVIDRRTNPNSLYVYSIPNHNQIPHDYCIESLISSAARYVIPNEFKQSTAGNFVGGRFDQNGYQFQLSYQLMQADHIRMHWFYAGGGMRFWPDLMVTLWPSLFKSFAKDNRYTEKFVNDKFALGIGDKLFDSWSEELIRGMK